MGKLGAKLKFYCPRCGEIGRIEKQSENIFRINHDKMIKGKKYPKRCYLGNLDDARTKIHAVSKIRPDIINKDVDKKIDQQLEKNENIDEKYKILIYEILKISVMLGRGWSHETHHLVKQDDCPHCKKSIAVRFVRAGKDPNSSKGNYNIEKLWIEKGKRTYTSRLSGYGLFETHIEKGKKRKSYTYTEDNYKSKI
jgi:hypothetical protein